MRRYNHLLKTAKGGRYPRIVICVDAVSDGVLHNGHTDTVREYLTSWHAVTLTRQKTEYHDTGYAAGNTVDGWWRYLEMQCHDGIAVWIASAWCGRVWTLLDLWGALEDGRIRLCRQAERTGADSRDAVLLVRPDCSVGHTPGGIPDVPGMQGQGENSGILVCSDPPNILSGRVRDSRVTWVDTRNYGIAPPAGIRSGLPLARHVGECISKLAGAIRRYSLGSLQTTAGAQAMHGFRAGYYRGGIWCHNDATALAGESDSYYGGRCEAFRIGDTGRSAWHFDYRSLYPSVCVQHGLPIRYRGRRERTGGPGGYDRATLARAIARVTIRTDEPAYPYRRGEIVIWPVGTFTTTLCGPGLTDAFDRDRITELHWIQEYELDSALADYCDAIHRARSEAEDAHESDIAAMCKLLSVSLPGKFGQRRDGWEHCPSHPPDCEYGQWIGRDDSGAPCEYRAVAGQTFKRVKGDWLPDACPAIAAWITSLGRMRLLDAIRAAGWAHTYYVDTDALIVDDEGMDGLVAAGLVRERTLGYLSAKGYYDSLDILGIKYYRHDGITVCAGQAIERSQQSDTPGMVWIQRGPDEYVRQGRRPDVVSELQPYQRTLEYRHGVVRPDGTVTPHRIEG